MTELGILIVEDSQRDLDLIVHEFSRSGYAVHAEIVETAKEMSAALLRDDWDVIISDNALPTFDANRALAVLQSSHLDIPFIIVSGMIGEERAVLFRAGQGPTECHPTRVANICSLFNRVGVPGKRPWQQ